MIREFPIPLLVVILIIVAALAVMTFNMCRTLIIKFEFKQKVRSSGMTLVDYMRSYNYTDRELAAYYTDGVDHGFRIVMCLGGMWLYAILAYGILFSMMN